MSNQESPWPLGVSDFSITEPLLNAATIIDAGFDYVEPGLAKAVAMPQQEFSLAKDRILSRKIPVLSMNWFVPPDVKVTGPDLDAARYRGFVDKALALANGLGAKAVVFGSPGARNIPDGFPMATALDQLEQFFTYCADVIRDNGYQLKIGIEHVNYTESNILRLLSDAVAMAKRIGRPEIGVTVDFYHLAMEKEPLETILLAGGLAVAVQLADPATRCFPGTRSEIPGLVEFFRMLRAIDYRGGVSVEANVSDLESEGADAVVALKMAIAASI